MKAFSVKEYRELGERISTPVFSSLRDALNIRDAVFDFIHLLKFIFLYAVLRRPEPEKREDPQRTAVSLKPLADIISKEVSSDIGSRSRSEKDYLKKASSLSRSTTNTKKLRGINVEEKGKDDSDDDESKKHENSGDEITVETINKINPVSSTSIEDSIKKIIRIIKEDDMKNSTYSSENRVYEVLYENQRGYSPMDIYTFQLPDPTWEWVNKEWLIDMSGDVDQEGWEYSIAFNFNRWHALDPNNNLKPYEILKAAVSKYGKNQWARISSLLVRKSPKQCKARWYEWLDPSIKKTEWSKEEDEKLLHLAKLMPTQWRTIAPIVGRTPAQCLERYAKLLDEAEAKERKGSSTDAGPSADDVRKLRPGEIDPDPETKPARPDPIDMDEDEKEMLSEARARLANTQGKKAKRKAREKQLEEARRLATMQKRRELKAAGIDLKIKKKKKGMDYNADIPFEKRPAMGFYDTTEERDRKLESGLINVHLHKLEGKRGLEDQEESNKKKFKNHKNEDGKAISFVPARNSQLNKLKQAEQISRRRKLVLPSPQVGDNELEEIVKIGFAGENTKAIVGETGNSTTLAGYTPSASSLPLRTPRAISGMTQTPKTPATIFSKTPRTPAITDPAAFKRLKAGLLGLPAPKNDFEIVWPNAKDHESSGEDDDKMDTLDASDREKLLKAQLEEQEQANMSQIKRRIKFNLPEPTESILDQLLVGESSEIDKLISQEIIHIVNKDGFGNKHLEKNYQESTLFTDEELQEVMSSEEYKSILEELDNIPKPPENLADLSFDYKEEYDNDIKTLKTQFLAQKDNMTKDASKATKIEKRLGIILGGYIGRSQNLKQKILELSNDINEAIIQHNSFELLRGQEKIAAEQRVKAIKSEVDKLARRKAEIK
ncbi:5235_t:CDS:10 [Entrophospora sp. SA101]|nr:5235_t:CDS:10 [Entrophospora sp. SA101]